MSFRTHIALPIALLCGTGHSVTSFAQNATFLARQSAAGNANAQGKYAALLEEGAVVPRDYSEAFRLYLKSAEQNTLESQYRVGLMYASGRGCTQNKEQAANWLREAAERGHPEARLAMGVICEYGIGSAKSETEAARWYLSAAKSGLNAAKFHAARCYGIGIGVPKDPALAQDWITKAQEPGNPVAAYALAKTTPMDAVKASATLMQASEFGYMPAVCELKGSSAPAPASTELTIANAAYGYGDWRRAHAFFETAEGQESKVMRAYCLIYGLGIIPDKHAGVTLLKECAAAGNTAAAYAVACRYESGDGVTKDKQTTVLYLKQAGQAGHHGAEYALAMKLLKGDGVSRDETEAMRLLKLAAAGGNIAAKGELGKRLYAGIGGGKSKEQGLALLQNAANSGDSAAQYSLGLKLLSNRDSAERAKGIALLDSAAKQGHIDAALAAGHHYLNEVSAENETTPYLAPTYFEMAATRGSTEAQWMMARLNLTGIGVTSNQAAAIVWAERAANAGHAAAQNLLGEAHLYGIGIPANQTVAQEWFTRAADKKNPAACVNLGKIIWKNSQRIAESRDGAAALFDVAVKSDDPAAIQAVGIHYIENRYMNVGYGEYGLSLLVRAAEAGAVESMLFLAKVHREGLAGRQDQTQAVAWYKRAAEAGSVQAADKLITAYELGEGVLKNTEESEKWRAWRAEYAVIGANLSAGEFKLKPNAAGKVEMDVEIGAVTNAAKTGDAVACHNLGLAYLKGIGVSRNPVLAREWFEKSVKSQYAPAINALATLEFQEWKQTNAGTKSRSPSIRSFQPNHSSQNMSVIPLTTEPGDPVFLKLLRESAASGCADAMMNLGLCYANGWGVPTDTRQSYAWFSVSAAAGSRAGFKRRLVHEVALFGQQDTWRSNSNSMRLPFEQQAAALWEKLRVSAITLRPATAAPPPAESRPNLF